MQKLVITGLFLLFYGQVFSQLQISDAEVILQSRHVWRGEKLGTAPAIEPSVTLSVNRFSFNIWTSVTTNNSYSEIDLVPAFQFNKFRLTLFDYYNPVSGENNQYLNFRPGKNRHSVELTIDNYSVKNSRFKWMAGTFLLGDKNSETGRPFYSAYLEFIYPFTLWIIDAEPFAGLTPFKGYYANTTAIINSGISFSKEVALTSRFTIPINVTYTYNPYQDKQMVTLSTGLVFSSGKQSR